MGPSLNPKSSRARTAHSVKYIKRRRKSRLGARATATRVAQRKPANPILLAPK